jgi:hypothetical protein
MNLSQFHACSPVVEYSREFRARAVEKLALLPEGLNRPGVAGCRLV